MATSVLEFWKLVEQSRLLAAEQCFVLNREFKASNGSTGHASPAALAEWLVSRNIFSPYQASVLLAGQPGPFVYGDYKIYDRVESGRLANEFRAVHSPTGHPVLLRFLGGALVQDGRLWTIAVREAQAAASIVHPNLQRIFELVDLGPFKFLVEEDLHGETLAEKLAAGRMPPQEACRIAWLIAQGLSALHSTGRVHGDVRPLNVWLSAPAPPHPGEVKLLRDPLLPPAAPNFAVEDPHGWLLNQCDYLAPEYQIPGKTPDVLTDLYALGCTFYHMLAGHPPFPEGNVAQKMARHVGEPIRPLESYGVPPPLAQLVMYLMAKNPALRYQEARAVVQQLAPFVDPAVINLPTLPPATLPAYEAAVYRPPAQHHAPESQNTFGIQTKRQLFADPEAAFGAAVHSPGAAMQGSPAHGSSAPAIAIRTEIEPTITLKRNDPRAIARRRAKQRTQAMVVLLSLSLLGLGAFVVWRFYGDIPEEVVGNPADPDTSPPIQPVPPTPMPTPGDGNQTGPDPAVAKSDGPTSAADSGSAYQVVADDGKLPWASPTAGPPVELKYVPPMGGVFIVVRGAELLASPEGPKVLQALGPQFQAVRESWEKAAGVTLADCERVIVTLHSNDNQFPRVSVVVRPKTPLQIDQLVEKWGNPTAKTAEAGTWYEGPEWSYYAPAEEKGAVFVMGAADDVQVVLSEPLPFLKREMEQVRRATDADRHVTVLFDPTFLFSGDGDPLFEGDLARAKVPIRWLLGDDLQVGAASLHLAGASYFELRTQTKVETRPDQLAFEFRERLAKVPDQLENYYADLDAPRYWSKLANRFAIMVRSLHEYTRVGAEGNQAVVNAVLPRSAAHNLVLGAELTISTAPGAAAVATTDVPAAAPKSLDDVMNLKIKSYSFAQQTFEEAIKEVEGEAREQVKGASLEVAFRIIGEDLETDGITRNRSLLGFSQENKTVGEVLTALCMKNNPITTVKAPHELDQKLIWVIGEDPDDKKQKVIITTRAGAEKRGYQLPAAFKPK